MICPRLLRKILFILLLLANGCYAATFQIASLSPLYQKQLITLGLWQPNCPVALRRLRALTISYYDFHGNAHHNGKIVVLDAVATPVITIFRKLYQMKFPVKTIKLISDYHGHDDVAMKANNTSSFNCRPITGKPAGSTPSIHAYGLAIDINPVQNPYISFSKTENGVAHVKPFRGVKYLNRKNQRTGMAETLVSLFKNNGFFIWGGQWNNPIDYQHFQSSPFVAQMLTGMRAKDATLFFKIIMGHATLIKNFTGKDSAALLKLYKRHMQRFDAAFKAQLPYLKNHNVATFTRCLTRRLNTG